MTSRFALGDTDFLLDGTPHRVLSGALHYFRIHPGQWQQRIRLAKQLGLNTIETYVPWNDHAPTPEAWIADGGLDLGRFLDLIHAEGLHAIVRPGPYICAEYDNGGLPAWLFADPATGIRRSEPAYLAAVESYLRRVYEIVAPRQIDHGGPVVLVQIENEYGAYGSDHDYLRTLVDISRNAGIDVPLTTVDQPEPHMLENGSLPELLKTGSFGSRSRERLRILREHQPTGPLMCSEYWNGWFDFWGGSHHTTAAAEQARDLDELLSLGASVNLYMLHGGTNFGLTNGANDKGTYEPTVTSYDYDAPIDEAGNPTEKFFAFREVFAKYVDLPPLTVDRPGDAVTPELRAVGSASLLDAIGSGSESGLGAFSAAASGDPALFDDFGHYRGFLALRASLDGLRGDLVVGEVRDRAIVFVDGVRVGVLERASHDTTLTLPAGQDLVVLVEDQGRVNYDQRLGEPKGLIGPVTMAGLALAWAALPLDLEAVRALPLRDGTVGGPALHRFEFDLEQAADLFVDTGACGKGVAYVNGFALGRYWERGPQRTLYVPGPATVPGRNVLEFIELDHDAILPVFAVSADLGPVSVDTLAVQGA